MEATAIEIANDLELQDDDITIDELWDPETNINIGVRYFSDLLKRYDNNTNLALIAYNAGFGNVDKWIREGTIKMDGSDIENVPFKETNSYVRKILRNYEIYKSIYK
jgi:soluble lytic murein transglycosylase